MAAVVAALQAHPSEVGVQRTGCGVWCAVQHRALRCSVQLYAQAVPGAGGRGRCSGVAVAVVAALQAHLSHVAVQQNGCGALSKIAHGGAMCAQAVVYAGGMAAVVGWWRCKRIQVMWPCSGM